MSYEEFVTDAVKAVEAIGAGIMVLGGLAALIRYGTLSIRSSSRPGSYERLRQDLAKVILLGLEILIIGDIVRTIIVDPTLESVAVLGLIVVIRIILSFSLEVEVEGAWPWARWRLGREPGGADPPPSP